jgi:hypothetical protein
MYLQDVEGICTRTHLRLLPMRLVSESKACSRNINDVNTMCKV